MFSVDLKDIEFVVKSFRDANYLCIASLALLGYDYLLTIDDELKSFWFAPWSWPRVIFFLNRYLSIVFTCVQVYGVISKAPSYNVCRSVIASVICGNMLAVTFSAAILSMRICALFKPYRLVHWLVVMLFIMAFVANVVLFVVLQVHLVPSAELQAIVHGCPSTVLHGHIPIWRSYVPTLILQTFLSAMILYKVVWRPFQSESARSLSALLARDGTIVYLVILVTIIISIIGGEVQSIQIPLTVSTPLMPVTSICTNRLLINLRAHISQVTQEHGYLSAVELTGLYLGGYRGGIAPARGVEGATVKEIGNTTVIDVPVRSIDDLEGSEAHTAYSERHGSMSLKVSAFGATPKWERWDHRVPTKDFKLPSVPAVLEQGGHVHANGNPHARSEEGGGEWVPDVEDTRWKRRSRRPDTTTSQSTLRPDTSSTRSRPGTSGTERTLIRKNSYYASAAGSSEGGSSPSGPTIVLKSSRRFTADEDLGRE